MTNHASSAEAALFGASIARTVDRLQIAGRDVIGPDQLATLGEQFMVPPAAAGLVAGFLPADHISWSALGAILRYQSDEVVRGQAEQLASYGVLAVDGEGVSYTDEGRRSAQAVVDLMPGALDGLWSVDQAKLPRLAELANAAATAALADDTISPRVINATLRPAATSASYELWRSLAIIRRHRADAHATAWASAGHSRESIQQLATGAERDAIEEQTNQRNAVIWNGLDQGQRTELLSGLAGLNGTGNPT